MNEDFDYHPSPGPLPASGHQKASVPFLSMSNTEPLPFRHPERSRGIAPRLRGASSDLALAQKLQRERPRNTKHPRLRAADGARSLHYGRDDGKSASAR